MSCANKSCRSKPTSRNSPMLWTGVARLFLFQRLALLPLGTLILATILGVIGLDPTVLIGSIAAVIGGTVTFGSNTSTLKQTTAAIEAAEAHRAELISRIDLRVVGGG